MSRLSRPIVASLAAVLVGAVGGCARDPIRPYPGEPTPEFRIEVDAVPPEWSHDGHLIAFRRRLPSSYGPPGLYVVDAAGGTPRFLAPGGWFFPDYFRFSPDDRYIACYDAEHQLLVVDLLTGQVSRPMYTANGVDQPDWDPTGRFIAYRRWGGFADDPLDSLGLHIFDTASGTDQPISYQGNVQWGGYPLWSKDGTHIAIVEFLGGNRSRLSTLRPDGSALRVVLDSQPDTYVNLLRKYVRRDRGLDGLAFSRSWPAPVSPPGVQLRVGGYFFINWDGSGLVPLPRPYDYANSYSPDGSWGVGGHFDPVDSNAVLFVFRSDDLTGASYRQLTWYIPPNALPAAILSRRTDP